jgi:outer membrane protein assembly factor BamB
VQTLRDGLNAAGLIDVVSTAERATRAPPAEASVFFGHPSPGTGAGMMPPSSNWQMLETSGYYPFPDLAIRWPCLPCTVRHTVHETCDEPHAPWNVDSTAKWTAPPWCGALLAGDGGHGTSWTRPRIRVRSGHRDPERRQLAGAADSAAGGVSKVEHDGSKRDAVLQDLMVIPASHVAAEGGPIETSRARAPMMNTTLGGLAGGIEVHGPERFAPTIVMLSLEAGALAGIDERTVRMFRADVQARMWHAVWASGVNAAAGYAWARVRRPGIYIPVGLPRDHVLVGLIRTLAYRRHLLEDADLSERLAHSRRIIDSFLDAPEAQVDQLRSYLAQLELRTTAGSLGRRDLERRRGGTAGPFPLPGNVSLGDFRLRIRELDLLPGGLPEEQLFTSPDRLRAASPDWPVGAGLGAGERSPVVTGNPTRLWEDLRGQPWWVFDWLSSPDWPMYHADFEHSGVPTGSSGIDSSTVASLYPLSPVLLTGTVQSVPAIAGGKAYVGTWTQTNGGTLYRVDLATASVDWQFPIPGSGRGDLDQWGGGIASTPAVVGGFVYFTSLDGRVWCVDAPSRAWLHPITTGAQVTWVTDLRHRDLAHNQPCDNSDPPVACWTSPLVVGGKVYVGCGLGENALMPPFSAPANHGFVYCLDAATGHVLWLFCTNKFSDVENNNPNDIPPWQLKDMSGPLPAGFVRHASDPPVCGASVWSSPVYDSVLNRVYVGTGNPYPDHALPNEPYSSGVLSLDAATGTFMGFFQPDPSTSYRPDDEDVDFGASPTLVRHGDTRSIGIGSKNGSYFLLDPDGLHLQKWRQMLPYYTDDNGNDDPTKPIPGVDEHSGTDHSATSGTFSCAAIDYKNGILFCGLGSDDNLNTFTTPFLRAMRWDTLNDAWPTVVGPVRSASGNVRHYQIPGSPLYSNDNEKAVGSPAVVNDVVFVSTTKAALYALDTASGALLWQAPDLTSGYDTILGAAISGDYVVIGYKSTLRIYHRHTWQRSPSRWQPIAAGPWPRFPLTGMGPVEWATIQEPFEQA